VEFPSLTIHCTALLGRKDEPTDAVQEYCRFLAAALQAHDIQLTIRCVPWEIHGWPDALHALRLEATQWRGTWVLVQYTALAWSTRGFPQKVLHSLKILKFAGARVGIIFHDVEPYPGARLIDSIRRFAQVYAMRRALALAELSIFTVPPERLSWLTAAPQNAVFVPVGPNLPIPPVPPGSSQQDPMPTIGVFSITGGESGARETKIILASSRYVAQKLGKLRLSIFGRSAKLRETELREGLRDLPIELSVEGVIEPLQVVLALSACDVLLFVRGHISSRRGSAIAGIACGLPVIAYPGSETAAPITDAGVVLVSPDQPDELNAALVRVLSDTAYRMDLAARSRAAYKTHFAWSAIAARFSTLLNTP
jgi:glycosyltransferase involved in cell wall biosynthesis